MEIDRNRSLHDPQVLIVRSDSGKSVSEKPFSQLHRVFWACLLKSNPGAAGGIGPNHPPNGLEIGLGFGKVNREIQGFTNFHLSRALEGHAFFAQIDNLMK